MPPKFLPPVPWNLGRKVPRTFQAILVAFWGSRWLPKFPSGFPGVVPSRIYNEGSDPTEALCTHLARYAPKLPPSDGRILLSLAMFYVRHRWYM